MSRILKTRHGTKEMEAQKLSALLDRSLRPTCSGQVNLLVCVAVIRTGCICGEEGGDLRGQPLQLARLIGPDHITGSVAAIVALCLKETETF